MKIDPASKSSLNRCLAVIITAILIYNVSFGQQKQDDWKNTSSTRWLDHRQLAVIEFPNLNSFIKLLRRTDIFTNRRWNDVKSNLTHEEFGLFNIGQWEFLQNKLDEGLAIVKFDNCVLSVRGVNDWSLIVSTAIEDPHEILQWLQACADEFRELQDEEIDGVDQPTDLIDWNLRTIDTIGNVEIKRLDRFFLFFLDGNVVLTTSLENAISISKRMQNLNQEPYIRFVDSRKYMEIRHHLASSHSATSGNQLFCYVDPKVIWDIGGWFSEKQQQVWGLNEILATGFTLKFVPSKIRLDQSELVIEAFLKPSTPRKGIADAIRLKGTPNKLPPLPGGVRLFYVSNGDKQFLLNEQRRLWDEADGEGSFEKYQNMGSPMRALLGEEYRKDIRDSQGEISGTCWYANDDEVGTLIFQQVTDVPKRLGAFESMATKGGGIASNYGYDRGDILGYPALFAKISRPEFKFAIAFIQDDWAIHGEEKVIKKIINSTFNNRFPQEVEDLLQKLLKHADIEDERSIVAAVLPQGWELIGTTVFASRASEKIFKDLLNANRGDIAKTTKEFSKVTADWNDVKLNEPKSRKHCIENARITLERIGFESLGNFVMLGNDTQDGWKFAAMLLPIESDDVETNNDDD